jgi:hypothetical protein
MNLFSRWRKSNEVVRTHSHGNKGNNKSFLIGNKQGLFDDIVGFVDVKSLFEMASKLKDRYIYCCVALHHLGNRCS